MSWVYDFGLGGQFPDSSTNFLLSPKKWLKATLLGKAQSGFTTFLGRRTKNRYDGLLRHYRLIGQNHFLVKPPTSCSR